MKRKETINEFKRAAKKDLEKIILEKSGLLSGLNFDLPSGKVKNIRQIRQVKRDIARAKTLLKQKKSP